MEAVIPDRRNRSAKMLQVLVSMDVTSLYTNIPQEEGITIMCKAYETFYRNEPPIPRQYLADMLRLILKENPFQFVGKKATSKYKVRLWGQKMAVAFANIFMSAIETEIINKSPHQPLVWKRFVDDIFSLWNIDKEEVYSFRHRTSK